MKFFIDTANLDQIKEAQELGVLDGQTATVQRLRSLPNMILNCIKKLKLYLESNLKVNSRDNFVFENMKARVSTLK